jgi:hypothetical protein
MAISSLARCYGKKGAAPAEADAIIVVEDFRPSAKIALASRQSVEKDFGFTLSI